MIAIGIQKSGLALRSFQSSFEIYECVSYITSSRCNEIRKYPSHAHARAQRYK